MKAQRVALVTGCGKHRGIGAATARRLSEDGFCVVVSDISPQGTHNFNEIPSDNAEALGTDGLVAEIRNAGRRAMAVVGDVARPEDATRMVAETLGEFGRLDVLVNNAAAPQEALVPIEQVTLTGWQHILDVNLTGTFLMSQAASLAMKQGGWGRIVNMSSVMGKKGRAQRLAYCTSKAGILGLTRALALELAPDGIAVNALCPGPILTTRALSSARRDGDTGQWMERGKAAVPLGRLGTAEDVASAVGYLCRDDSAFITGQSIDIDGGWGI